MIGLELIVLFSSSFCIYEALTYIGVLGMPYISFLSNINAFFTVVKVCALKWSMLLGLFGIVYAIISMFLFRQNADLMKYRIVTTGFYLVILLIMLF